MKFIKYYHLNIIDIVIYSVYSNCSLSALDQAIHCFGNENKVCYCFYLVANINMID